MTELPRITTKPTSGLSGTPSSTVSSSTMFMNWSKPRRMPVTWFGWGGWSGVERGYIMGSIDDLRVCVWVWVCGGEATAPYVRLSIDS